MTSTPDIFKVIYQLDFERYHNHLVDVTMTFEADVDSPIVWLPSWVPGSYLMREFSRHITAVHYTTEDINIEQLEQTDADDTDLEDVDNNEDKNSLVNITLADRVIQQNKLSNKLTNKQGKQKYKKNCSGSRANKLTKNQWQLDNVKAGDTVRVRYEVYCYDLSVRTAYVDSQRLYGNFSALLLTALGKEDDKILLMLNVPSHFYEHKMVDKVTLSCGLPWLCTEDFNQVEFTMQADSYHDLIDYPFELAEQDKFEFFVNNKHFQNIRHSFFISGKHTSDLTRLQKDIKKICQTYVNWLGDTPFDNYTFMTFATGNDYGGLEHINSTSLVTPRTDLPSYREFEEPSVSYQRYLGLCSHEYFHSWWVKTVRPDVMMDVDLTTEAYTPLLWVFEGFTSYIDDFMLQASGVVSTNSYLKLLNSQINRYNQTAGRMLQSVAESSFDAWIKLYRADENTANAGISYYNKGALVALCLDLVMLKETGGMYRLFDIVKIYYEKAKTTPNQRFGMTTENLSDLISRFIDTDVWQDFYQRYIIGVDKLPLYQLLMEQGIKVDFDNTDNIQPWGMSVTEQPEGLLINKVYRNSVASEAGLSAKDVIVAIDGIKATKQHLTNIANRMSRQLVNQKGNPQINNSIACHAFRRDELMQFDVASTTHIGKPANHNLGKVKLSIDENRPDAMNIWLNINVQPFE